MIKKQSDYSKGSTQSAFNSSFMLGHTGPKHMEMSRIDEDDYTYQIAIMGGRTAGKKTFIEYMLKVSQLLCI